MAQKQSTQTTRRKALKYIGSSGAIVAGAGVAAGQPGGGDTTRGSNVLIREEQWEQYQDDQFTFIERRFVQEIQCRGQPREWRCFIVEMENDGERIPIFIHPPHHEFERVIDGGLHEFAPNAIECQDTEFVHTAFHPYTGDRNGNGNGNGDGNGNGNA